MSIWSVLNSLSTITPLNENIVNEYLNKSMLVFFLAQKEETINIAYFISKNLLDKDIYLLYLYSFSKYPKGLKHSYIKSNQNKKNIDLLLEIFNSNRNDVLNILKSMNNNQLCIIQKEFDDLKLNNIFFDDIEKELYFSNL